MKVIEDIFQILTGLDHVKTHLCVLYGVRKSVIRTLSDFMCPSVGSQFISVWLPPYAEQLVFPDRGFP